MSGNFSDGQQEVMDSEGLLIEAKQLAIVANLPSWSQVQTAINNAANLVEAKVILLKLARVVYWLAKNSEE